MQAVSPFRAELGRSCLRAAWYSARESNDAMLLAKSLRGDVTERMRRGIRGRDPLGKVAVSWEGRGMPFTPLKAVGAQLGEDDAKLVNWTLERNGITSEPVILEKTTHTEWQLHLADAKQAQPHRLELLLWLAEATFNITSVRVHSTGEVLTDLPTPPSDYAELLQQITDVLAEGAEAPPRVIELGKCDKCPFFATCMPREAPPQGTARHEIWDVPKMRKAKMLKSYLAGVRYADEVDEGVPSGGKVVDRKGLLGWLEKSLKGGDAVWYLDFETVGYKGEEGYVRLPLQFSVHRDGRGWGKLAKNVEEELQVSADVAGVSHTEYLTVAPIQVDDRENLVKALLEATQGKGPIVVWHASFEKSVLTDLSKAFPSHSQALQDRIRRLVDLSDPFKTRLYRSHATYTSSSVKVVLPALCHTLHYPPSPISSGAQATSFMYRMYKGLLPVASINRMVPHLLTYCRLDTAAMLGIASALKREVRNKKVK